jgi:hypothetical protein
MRCCAHEDITIAKIDDNAEEGVKLRDQSEALPQHFGVVIENRLQVYSSCFI